MVSFMSLIGCVSVSMVELLGEGYQRVPFIVLPVWEKKNTANQMDAVILDIFVLSAVQGTFSCSLGVRKAQELSIIN